MLSADVKVNLLYAASQITGIICRAFFFVMLWNTFVPLCSDSIRIGSFRAESLIKPSFAGNIPVKTLQYKNDCGNNENSLKARFNNFNAPIKLFILISFMEIARWFTNEDGWPFEIIILSGIALSFMFVYKREYIKETIFTLVLYLNLRYLSWFFVNSFMNELIKRVMTSAGPGRGSTISPVSTIGVLFFVAEALYCLVLFGEILPFIKSIQQYEKMSFTELCYLSVMNIAGIILTRIMLGIAVFKTTEGDIVLLDMYPYLVYLLPAIAQFLYLGELCAVIIWKKYNQYRQKSEMVFAGNVERESIQRRLEDTERYYEQVRKARHEMANHLTTIRGLAEQGLLIDMKQYISEIDDTIQSVEMRYFTGNPVTDVVINDKYRKAKEKGVLFSSVFSFDESWGIAVYDLSIVLSNILDNAIKAAEESADDSKYVSIKAVDKENVVLIVCENGFDKSTHTERDADDFWHGIGLKNVADIAERYDGTMRITEDGEIFKITVMLKKRCPSDT